MSSDNGVKSSEIVNVKPQSFYDELQERLFRYRNPDAIKFDKNQNNQSPAQTMTNTVARIVKTLDLQIERQHKSQKHKDSAAIEIEDENTKVSSTQAVISTTMSWNFGIAIKELDVEINDAFIAKDFHHCLILIEKFASCFGFLSPNKKLLKARCLIRIENFDDAIEILERNKSSVINTCSDYEVDALTALSECYYLLGELQLTISTCEDILKKNPNNENVIYRKNNAEHFQKSLKDSVSFYNHREYKKALDVLLKVVHIDRENKVVTSTVLSNRGMGLKQLYLYDKALKSFDEALELWPGNKTIHEKRAICLFKTRNFEKCIEDCEEALKMRQMKNITNLLERSRKEVFAKKNVRMNKQN